MLVCTGLCEYYETYKTFSPQKSYLTHKRCSRCDHVVPKLDFPDSHCYCCNSIYRDKYTTSIITRRIARSRKKDRRKKTETNEKLEETVNKLRY